MASKKKIQCTEISNPTKINLKNSLIGIRKDSFLKSINRNKKTDAKSILYQTNASAWIEIKAPKMAVKPQINTIKCSFK